MIWKVIDIHLRRLRHNRVEWLLTFVVPIAFFSIFALIFTRGVGGTPRIKVVLLDQCARTGASEHAAAVFEHLKNSDGLRIVDAVTDARPNARVQAETLVRRGAATIAIVLKPSSLPQSSEPDEPSGSRATAAQSTPAEAAAEVTAELLNDASDQVASQVVTALVTRAFLQTKFGRQAGGGRSTASESGRSTASEMRSEQQSGGSAGDAEFADFVRQVAKRPAPSSGDAADLGPTPPSIEVVNILGKDKSNPVVSVYAAGIAVMFLLFGATSGGGVLLEERENQTLERLLSTQMTMDHLLLGKWFYLTMLGIVQVTVMFLWAQAVFGLDLIGHLDGFLMMTIVTSSSAASFGLFLATLCRTRGQLNGLSVVLVLTMSALGGSMVPRYVMSEQLQEVGLWTFNAWALDGYDKVFWRDLPPAELGPQLAVLMGTAIALLVTARLLAIRWETS